MLNVARFLTPSYFERKYHWFEGNFNISIPKLFFNWTYAPGGLALGSVPFF